MPLASILCTPRWQSAYDFDEDVGEGKLTKQVANGTENHGPEALLQGPVVGRQMLGNC